VRLEEIRYEHHATEAYPVLAHFNFAPLTISRQWQSEIGTAY